MLNRDSKFHNYVMTAIIIVGFLVMGYTILNWNSIVASHQRAEVKALAEAAELKSAQGVLLKKLTDSNDLGLKEYAIKWEQDNPEPTKRTIEDLERFIKNVYPHSI